MRRHAELLCVHMGADKGIRDMRKHIAWYLKGFPVGPETRRRLGLVESLDELDELLAALDPELRVPGRRRGPARDGRARPVASCCRRAGWTTRTTPPCRSAPSWSTRAAEVRPRR